MIFRGSALGLIMGLKTCETVIPILSVGASGVQADASCYRGLSNVMSNCCTVEA